MFLAVLYFIVRLLLRLTPEGDAREREAEILGFDISWGAEAEGTEGQLRVRALDSELVWLAHEHEPWRPRAGH